MSYSNNWLQTISEAYKSKAKKKTYVKEDTETLLAIIEVLCEELDIDVNVLMEETIEDMKNLGHAHGWDKPAPEGAARAAARLKAVKKNMRRLGKRGTRYLMKTGENTALETEHGPMVHEPTAHRRATGAARVEINDREFDKVQGSIQDITDRVGQVEKQRGLIQDLQNFAIGGNKPKKGKGKK